MWPSFRQVTEETCVWSDFHLHYFEVTFGGQKRLQGTQKAPWGVFFLVVILVLLLWNDFTHLLENMLIKTCRGEAAVSCGRGHQTSPESLSPKRVTWGTESWGRQLSDRSQRQCCPPGGDVARTCCPGAVTLLPSQGQAQGAAGGCVVWRPHKREGRRCILKPTGICHKWNFSFDFV